MSLISGTQASTDDHAAKAEFVGVRSTLFGQLLAGYLLLVPTLGLFRFWMTTNKRRFYWGHTLIGGDALEYTGNARQLLTGFLLALGFFLPIYGVLIYLSLQAGALLTFGYIGAGALLWFFMGYAFYRGRDFRLSHTLWRGIRFGQDGNAWAYAVRRFLWSILVVVTVGLAYPFMAASLWRYRYDHTLFGDRRFRFEGSWKTIAGPFYRSWVAAAVALGLTVGLSVWAAGRGPITGGMSVVLVLSPFVVLLALLLAFVIFRAREASRMYSAVRLGSATLQVKVSAGSLFVQYFLFGLALLVAAVVVGAIGAALFYLVRQLVPFDSTISYIRYGTLSWLGLVGIVGGYLSSIGTLGLMGEVFIDLGYWMLVARGARVIGIETLDDVAAGAEDPSVIGEGLSDALNVGSF